MSFSRLAVFLAICSPLWAGYARRSTITFPAAASGTLTNITLASVTVAMNDLRTVANGGVIQHATCTHTIANVPCDLIVTDDAGCGAGSTAYMWGFETYDGVTGTVRLWILVPSLGASAVVPYVCFGNAAVSTYQGGAAGSEYDASTLLALPLPDGSSLSVADFSGHQTVTNNNNSATTGVIDGAASNPAGAGATDDIYISAPSGLYNPTAVTYEAWINAAAWTNPDGDARMQIQGVSGLYVWVNKTTGTVQVARTTTSSSRQSQTSSGLSTGAWNQVVTTYDSAGDNMCHIYVNGTEATYAFQTAGSGTNSTDTGKYTIGANPANEFAYNFPGSLDTVKAVTVARSADWIATEYANQLNPPAMSAPVSLGNCTLSLLGVGC